MKMIIYNKEKEYLIFTELDKLKNIKKGKIHIACKKNDTFCQVFEEKIKEIPKVYVNIKDLLKELSKFDPQFKTLKLKTNAKQFRKVKRLLQEEITFLKEKELQKVVFNCGIKPNRYIPYKLPKT